MLSARVSTHAVRAGEAAREHARAAQPPTRPSDPRGVVVGTQSGKSWGGSGLARAQRYESQRETYTEELEPEAQSRGAAGREGEAAPPPDRNPTPPHPSPPRPRGAVERLRPFYTAPRPRARGPAPASTLGRGGGVTSDQAGKQDGCTLAEVTFVRGWESAPAALGSPAGVLVAAVHPGPGRGRPVGAGLRRDPRDPCRPPRGVGLSARAASSVRGPVCCPHLRIRPQVPLRCSAARPPESECRHTSETLLCSEVRGPSRPGPGLAGGGGEARS